MMLIRSINKTLNTYSVPRFLQMYTTKTSIGFSALENRILKNGDPRTSMTPILNQWVEQGKEVTRPVLHRIITRLANYRRFSHALQVSEWMSNNSKNDLSPGDIAKRLNLISKVHGLEQAQKFFKGIPEAKIGFKIYAALLNCYAEHKSLEEAEVTMEKIKKLRPVDMTVCYNMMLKLYAQKGKHEKLDRLMQEMQEKDICNGATYTIRLNAYVNSRDIEGMEKLLMQMEADPVATVDWYTYATAANGYMKVGNVEKASEMMKKSENSVNDRARKTAYESLLTMHAAIGNKDEVYRLWNRCKNLRNSFNSSYLCMLSSLVKLDDVEGAEKILQEWESGNPRFDIRIPNMMITAYCKWGLFDKAEAYIKRLLDDGKELDGSTWDRLSSAYHTDNAMEKAVETLKKATLGIRRGWKPNHVTFGACIKYLKEKLDVEQALEILKLFKENGHISATTYDRLVSYVHGEIADAEAMDLIKQNFMIEKVQLDDEEN
ncbi:pentatricopeptide repeat-containing protein At2g20710, mitochondrial-like [Trifolium pratense]|uniref:pentatricopeptide repeat-containing protein At2g20710, mitochondrial-like n=1 Tax=Trifolium pratense TaxID=57577 RepID=UPI001E696650|nr:pentatricopeptide repeat-containing protein At2g20710, mitochondrial-like [Trifolium pratense]